MQPRTKEKFARIVCPECIEVSGGNCSGVRYLSKEEYDRQMDDPHVGWRCPVCRTYPCIFDDDYFERPYEKKT